jgi:hypothetical protein
VVVHGRYPGFYLETKVPGGKLSDEQRLEHMHSERGFGIRVAVIRRIEELIAWLEEHEREPR